MLKDYEAQKKEGKDPVFDPKNVGIEGLTFWEERSKEVQRKNVKEQEVVDDSLKL